MSSVNRKSNLLAVGLFTLLLVSPLARGQIDLPNLGLPGTADGAGLRTPTLSRAPATQPQPQAKSSSRWKIGDKVEVKDGAGWEAALVRDQHGDWFYLEYTGWEGWFAWVEPWRLRQPGSTADIPVWPESRKKPQKVQQPPTGNPGPMPAGNMPALPNLDQIPGLGPGYGRPETPAPGTGTPAPAAGAGTAVDRDGAVELALADAPWTYVPDPAPAVKATRGTIPLAAPAQGSGERADRFYVSAPDQAKAAILYVIVSARTPSARLERIDLAVNKPAESFKLPPGAGDELLGVSPSVTRLVMRAPDNRERLDVYELAAGATKVVVSFAPHGGQKWPDNSIRWARFVDNDHLLTYSDGQELELWKLPEVKLIYHGNFMVLGDPIFSPGGKYIILPAGDNLVLNALTGAPAGSFPGPFNGHYAVSPDGKRLACQWEAQMDIYNLETGKLSQSFTLPEHVSGAVNWAGNDYLLVDGICLLSVEKEVVVWNYLHGGGGPAPAMLGDQLWAYEDADTHFRALIQARRGMPAMSERKPLLVSVKIPDAPALAAAQKLSGDSEMALKPGVSVSLQINLSDAALTQRVKDALTKQLADNRITVAENQPLKFTLAVTPGKTREIKYTMSGNQGEGRTSFTSEEFSVVLTLGDQKIWSNAFITAPPSMISLKNGQTVAQALQAEREESYRSLETFKLPKRVPAPRNPPGYGETSLDR